MKEQFGERVTHFDAIKVSLASPEHILQWSHGEVTKPETINYRTQKPERDGLFCERIFGPTRDFECYCGKYKKVRYKGIICDKCGVQVTRSIVRRERMGHIKLAAPVAHVWYLRGVPSRIGMYLGISVRDLEKVVYFASFVVTDVKEKEKQQILAKLKAEVEEFKKALAKEGDTHKKALDKAMADDKMETAEKKTLVKKLQDELKAYEKSVEAKKNEVETVYEEARDDISKLAKYAILSEGKYADLRRKYGDFFKANIGAEAIYDLIREIDITTLKKELEEEKEKSAGQKKKKVMKRLRFVHGLVKASLDPAWMIWTHIAVIPPDLRPMVQLDGGRFATSDINDLYRRVINRNNRLKRLQELRAPEVIQRNEKRMLQEAVDALIGTDSQRGKGAAAANKKKLKSLSEALKGKQGRFRQNLLGKRVDYSGRSVIVVGPDLKLDECGIPKTMALELFKPFIISGLIARGFTHSAKSAGKLIDAGIPEVWDILEEVTSKHYVLLNRAPTLHRLGIQAFKVKLIEGKAIRIHPLVCAPFNADFDGDQMAIHVPLSAPAQAEARETMVASRNLLKPSDGAPSVAPSKDMVLGCYYLTMIDIDFEGNKIRAFGNENEAHSAYDLNQIKLREPIKVKIGEDVIETTIGRLMFNQILPPEFGMVNDTMVKGKLEAIIARSFKELGIERTAVFVDDIKNIGMKAATLSGVTLSIDDLKIAATKQGRIHDAEELYNEIDAQYKLGLITEAEKSMKTIQLWSATKAKIESEMMQTFTANNPLHMMFTSKARGDKDLITQLVAMRGLMAGPTGQTLDLPVKSNFKEGLSVLEYFISSHGARKGLADTALRTSDSGYLTRRLVDVCQDMIVAEDDCKTAKSISFAKSTAHDIENEFTRHIDGRMLAQDIITKKGKVLVAAGTELTREIIVTLIENPEVDVVHVRTVLECEAAWGICQMCYGRDLARGHLVAIGEAAGIVAAQSIGEPGTQLTMRTFHSGGIAKRDIIQGLPRVEELFEARSPKGLALISELTGKVAVIENSHDKKTVVITSEDNKREIFVVKKGAKVLVKDKDKVEDGQALIDLGKQKTMRSHGKGSVEVNEKAGTVTVTYTHKDEKSYAIDPGMDLMLEDGARIEKGDQITEGHIDLHELMDIKGTFAVKQYIAREIQSIYESQAQFINDKHLELIIRQMFSKMRIVAQGDSEYLEGEIVSRSVIEAHNKNSKKPIEAEELLLGITKAALNTESFLSAASFQETTAVLIDAATQGKVDYLRGLKENTILGKLIPAGTGFRKVL